MIAQAIRPAYHYPHPLHPLQLYRQRRDKRLHHALRRSALGSAQAHRRLGQPDCSILRRIRIHTLHPGHEHISELAERRE